ncbi:unnamed protein product [Bursaphelenchus okinawaensis]|uniref:Lipase n=1 Tax=Bursaphelenchus okinawaensis TaxID=465554 RepID=A0A811KP64_9BILA|nr:unnamed protein product [Bursaphelenchus okinawaensis]CAG9107756.1 unnamed protein product [Bursaphelenchus okinawaensis]
MLRIILIHLATVWLGFAEFKPHFREFLVEEFGRDVATKLERLDQGYLYRGSFGGKSEKYQPVFNRPIIFVHGVGSNAAFWLTHRQTFIDRGYSSAELYATTYGLLQNNITKTLDCKDVTAIRNFIMAVAKYTNSKVDILAYSMGVAIARKAILGGKCVDTMENLGPPFTANVETFLSVAGMTHGVENCSFLYPACNGLNGIPCVSHFFTDVNTAMFMKYEGTNLYAISNEFDTE